jgi:DNA modification methylase
MWAEKKATAVDRCARSKEIIGDSDESWIIWCDTNQEADLLIEHFPDAVEVRGSDSIAVKERGLNAFSDGTTRKIITKTEIAGFGLNWQHCHNMAFVGVSYSFEKLYQALRRSWRYGQTHQVNAFLIYAESEGDIMTILKEKQVKHHEMRSEMNAAMAENGWNVSVPRKLTTEIDTDYAESERWKLYLGDCVQELEKIDDGSIHLSVYSPPFSNLYIYSDSIADLGNSADHEEFFEHYEFVIDALHRKTMPGRLSAVHCKDLPLYHNRDGAAGLWDFPGAIIKAHEKHGWTYHSRVTIWKDPVFEMQRTKNHGLLYKNLRLRGEVVRQGMADYLLVFRKWEGIDGTESAIPVKHEREDFPLERWQKWASPVWMDIDQTNVLNYRLAREEHDERHICPLQLDVIERSIVLWTNPGELICDPFSGIGSTGFQALQLWRRYVGIELKRKYWEISQRYLLEAEKQTQKTLF